MSNYISSFFIEPVVRQARRFSRLSAGSEPRHSFANSLQDEHASTLGNVSPPRSIGEDGDVFLESGRMNSDVRIGPLQTTFDQRHLPSPPPDPTDLSLSSQASGHSDGQAHVWTFQVSEIPVQPSAAPSASRSRRRTLRTDNDTSINPSYGIPRRFRSSDQLFTLSSQVATDGSSASTDNVAQGDAGGGHDAVEAYNRNIKSSGFLPEDDGMGFLRKRIHDIRDRPMSSVEKARLIHGLMTENYSSSQISLHSIPPPRPHSPASLMSQDRPFTPSSANSARMVDRRAVSPVSTNSASAVDLRKRYNLTPDDLIPTYATKPPPYPTSDVDETSRDSRDEEMSDEEEDQLGCQHYKRNVKLQCFACKRWYTCRFCHDEVEDHLLNRQETENMLCMLCGCPQSAGEWCKDCGERAAWYYCSVCKLWDNDTEKNIYHCSDCGICRVGQGLGKDYFHCKTCAVCISVSVEKTHRCIERSTKCDCPICGEYMFTSPQEVIFMKCGHSIHHKCYSDYSKTSYRCPICNKSTANMAMQFRNLSFAIASQPMPPEYQDTKALISCNDCTAKSFVKYHWLGMPCDVCESYNTVLIQLVNGNDPVSPRPDLIAPAEALIVGAALPQDIRHDSGLASETTFEPTPEPRIEWTPETDSRRLSTNVIPQQRTARSISPAVGNYFGLQREPEPERDVLNADEDEDIDFWGGESPRHGNGDDEEDGEAMDESDDDEEDLLDDDMEDDDDDDDDDEDGMDIFGHR